MKTSGLPCRATPDCDAVFALTRQDSMDALREAAERRDAHELADHAYTHVRREIPGATPFSQSPAVSRRRVRRTEEPTIA